MSNPESLVPRVTVNAAEAMAAAGLSLVLHKLLFACDWNADLADGCDDSTTQKAFMQRLE